MTSRKFLLFFHSSLVTLKSRQAALIFILVTVTLDILAMGLIIPVLPKLILDFLGGQMTDAAKWSAWFAVVFALMQFIFSPLLGVLSDRFGRRPIILLSNLGLGLDYIVMALSPNLYWLFLGRVISGITTSSIPTAMAYIADVTPKEKRAGAFGMIGVAFGIGFTLGPGIGGLLGKFDPHYAFWFAATLSLLNWLWGFFFVPESLIQEKRKPFALRRANPVGSLKLLRSHHELWRLATIQFLAYLSHNVFSVWVLYAMYRYAWNTDFTGYSLVLVGVVTAAISGGLTGPMVKRFGEKRTLYIGQFFGASGMSVAGLAKNRRMVPCVGSNHFALEYFHARRPEHDDSSRQRTRAGRTARRDPELAIDYLYRRPVAVPSHLRLVYRSEGIGARAGRAILSGGGIAFYRHAHGHASAAA